MANIPQKYKKLGIPEKLFLIYKQFSKMSGKKQREFLVFMDETAETIKDIEIKNFFLVFIIFLRKYSKKGGMK